MNLITTPDFDGLPCLERLILDGCESLEEIHPSIGYHKRLVFVDMSECVRLKRFPPIIQMEKLETLILYHCEELQQFPDNQSNMVSLSLPNFDGLPCLERLILSYCESLEEIHPSIGYHKRLVFVNMAGCTALKMFPPIIHMKKLETLLLRDCNQLQQFLDIQSNMDSLVTLDLSDTGIEIIPSSFGRFCTNLVSLYSSYCYKPKWIDGSLHLLRSLKDLDLSNCNLGDGDIPSDICELLNLQLLDLTHNDFSRLPSGISRLPGLKLLIVSGCTDLVELPDLPSSIAILKADDCRSLEIVGDLSDYKCLWKVSLQGCYKLIGGERVLHSMLEGNVAKDRFMSVVSPNVEPSGIFFTISVTLQLPNNWYSEFSGFLLSLRSSYKMESIVIKQEMEMSTDHSEKIDKDCREPLYERVAYVPFSSLRHIPWFNPTYTKNISFHIADRRENEGLNVELVRSKSKIGDLNEHPIDYSECWDDKNKTFKIQYDSKSTEIQISWCH